MNRIFTSCETFLGTSSFSHNFEKAAKFCVKKLQNFAGNFSPWAFAQPAVNEPPPKFWSLVGLVPVIDAPKTI